MLIYSLLCKFSVCCLWNTLSSIYVNNSYKSKTLKATTKNQQMWNEKVSRIFFLSICSYIYELIKWVSLSWLAVYENLLKQCWKFKDVLCTKKSSNFVREENVPLEKLVFCLNWDGTVMIFLSYWCAQWIISMSVILFEDKSFENFMQV